MVSGHDRLRVSALCALRGAGITCAEVAGRPYVGRLLGRMIGAAPDWIIRPARSGLLTRRVATGLAAIGRADAARSFARAAVQSCRSDVSRAAHQLLVEMGEIDLAARRVRATGDVAAVLAADRYLALADFAAAAAALDKATDRHHPDVVARRVQLLSRSGRFDEVIGQIRRSESVPASRAAAAEFDALWSLGRPDEALTALEARIRGRWDDAELLRRGLRAARVLGIETDWFANAVGGLGPDARAVALFEGDRIDELIEFGETSVDDLGATGRYQLARARYVRRQFDISRRLTKSLRGTGRHWDAEKLESRMLLEERRFAEALQNRRTRTRFRQTFDEVEYFALLHLGRHEEAFATYLHRDDVRRLSAQFPGRAETMPTEVVASRFVITQNGPGDELMMAATFTQLAAISDELHATCDPRLTSLLRRSFPNVRFHPAQRLASVPQVGFSSDGRPDHADGPFFDLLSSDAHSIASNCDRVVMGRSLVRLGPGAAPYQPYLTADPETAAMWGSLIPPDAVGLIWRSEYFDAMRSIHYAPIDNLTPLAATPHPFVVLQHDIRDEERRAITAMFGDRAILLDDVDLRNDFETMAAVVSACAAVVGPGTTMVELAAALGVPSITLYPSSIGAWRSDRHGHDYWHARMRTAVADTYDSPTSAITNAAELLGSLVPG